MGRKWSWWSWRCRRGWWDEKWGGKSFAVSVFFIASGVSHAHTHAQWESRAYSGVASTMLASLRLARAAASLATAAAASAGARTINGLPPPVAALQAAAAAAAPVPGTGRPFAVGGLRWASSSSDTATTSAGEAVQAEGGPAEIGAAAAGVAASAPSTSFSSPGGRTPPPSSLSRRARRPAGPAPPPWAPTADLPKRKFLPRRMAHLMQVLEGEREAASVAARPVPDFRPGDALELKLAIAENRGRPATLRGVCIARRSAGWRSSLTLLSHIPGGGVVTRAVPLHSPALQELRVVERARVRARRAKLYYLSKRNPKEWRV